MIALIGGGARSGKSAFALKYAEELGHRRAFFATARPFDEEMRIRIECHRRERGDRFETFEAPTHLAERLTELEGFDVAVVDCLTVHLSNVLLDETNSGADVDRAAEAIIDALARVSFHVVLVTNEVGMGVVPATPLGRRFRDLLGRANQRFAERADEIYFATMGLVLRLHPAPVVVVAGRDP